MSRVMNPREVALRIAAERGGNKVVKAKKRRTIYRDVIQRKRDLDMVRLEQAFDDPGAALPAREPALIHVRIGQQYSADEEVI